MLLALLALAAGLASTQAAPGSAARDLHALFDEDWQARLRENPLLATAVGDHRYDDRLPSMTRADLERRAAFTRRTLGRLRAINRQRLGPVDRVSYALFERLLQDDLAEHDFGSWRAPINADSGFHTGFSRLPAEAPLDTPAHYRNYTARLRAFPAYAGQQIELMREGLRTGFTVPRITLAGYDAGIRIHVVEDPEKSVFFEPFRAFPVGVPEADRTRLVAEGRAAVLQTIAAYRQFLDFFVREYEPGARATTAAVDLPRGREYYAYLVRHFTTLEIAPEEVHQVGLREVERIQTEMAAVIQETGFKGDFAAFLEFLRTDPRFYARTPDELMKTAALIAKRMDGQLPALFGRLPRLPYGIEPVPADLAPKYTAGRYVEAPIGGTRAGTYWVNTYALPSRPLYALEALTLHEAVPGHHLQIALQQEMTDLPAFRRVEGPTAFIEGWGLYAERLGLEAGFYQDPYSRFGRLTYEMWRACRLVVDTGLHAFHWTREKAMEFMASHTALSRHEIETETDRYISWPGQALAYKMGELKIRELRLRAEAALGQHFDRRAFHDAVLANGPVPLGTLDEQIGAFIAAASASGATRPRASAPDTRH